MPVHRRDLKQVASGPCQQLRLGVQRFDVLLLETVNAYHSLASVNNAVALLTVPALF